MAAYVVTTDYLLFRSDSSANWILYAVSGRRERRLRHGLYDTRARKKVVMGPEGVFEAVQREVSQMTAMNFLQ